MIAEINFSLFSSPAKAYGNFSGVWDVPKNIDKGDTIYLIQKVDLDAGFKLAVNSVNLVEGKIYLNLEDIVLHSVEAANDLVIRIEKATNLFFDKY